MFHRSALAVCLVTAAFLSSGCGSKTPVTARETPVPIRVRKPATLDRPAAIRAGGTVDARESAEVGFQVAGRVTRVFVEEGQSVRRGQVLAELDGRDYQFGVDIAAGESDAAAAMAAKAVTGTRKQELEQARAAFEQADDEYKRMKALYDRHSLAPNDFKKIEAKWRVAQQQLNEASEGARVEDRSAAEGKARQAAANVKLNAKRLADTRLLAPLNGVVARRLTDPGEMVAAGMPVFAVMDLNPVRVHVGVPEAEITKVQAGRPAVVRIPSMGGQDFAGKVELVGYAAEPQSRTFAVRILVPNPKLVLRAGMIAEAEIESDTRVKVITIPGEAVVRDPQGATLVYVYYPEKQRVFARRVQVGRAYNAEIEIASGLTASDLIVVAGQQNVREGGLVQLAGAAQ
ncbi:efflux RND transporter periplasmic adaptor subunit [uncultured Paludibaculum sp.]|uniref:efflux RND transporter periplasmic adaptor subunit n=1 Tax=uncultured Paludibaculum sp. TaxID=1765020 RepID=UPI002AAA78DF|nr:efflux RND transporter periplasmic adaptor subunit [uncultured Paludibaculum sp.]